MKKITLKEQQKYLLNPEQCPFCNNKEIHANEFEFAGSNEAHRIIECESCFRTWREIFELQYIENKD